MQTADHFPAKILNGSEEFAGRLSLKESAEPLETTHSLADRKHFLVRFCCRQTILFALHVPLPFRIDQESKDRLFSVDCPFHLPPSNTPYTVSPFFLGRNPAVALANNYNEGIAFLHLFSASNKWLRRPRAESLHSNRRLAHAIDHISNHGTTILKIR
jgi:hypothetical protein